MNASMMDGLSRILCQCEGNGIWGRVTVTSDDRFDARGRIGEDKLNSVRKVSKKVSIAWMLLM